MQLKRSLAWRLSGWLLLCSVCVFFLIWFFVAWSVREQMQEQIDFSAMADVRSASAQLDRVFMTVQHSAENLAELMGSRAYVKQTERDLLKILLADLNQTNPAVCGGSVAPVPPTTEGSPLTMFYYQFKDRQFVGRPLGSPDYRYWMMAWYTIPQHTGKVHWSEPYFDRGGGNVLMTTCSVPYFRNVSGKKEFSGVVTVDLDLRKLDRIMKNIQLRGIGYAVLLSKQGIYLAHPDPYMICRESVWNVARKIGASELDYAGRRMMSGQEGMLQSMASSYSGKPTRFFYTPVRSTQWSIGVGFPVKDLLRPLRLLEVQLALSCIGGLLMLLVGMLILCRKITHPLLKLSEAAQSIGKGDFQGKLPDYPMEDEIGVLTSSFRQMQQELTRFIRELKISTEARAYMESEVQAAGAIQRSLLPKLDTAEKHRDEFLLDAVLHPAKGIGGDLYDFMKIGQYVLLSIGDVSGKGVPAALFMAVTQTLLRSQIQLKQSLSRAVGAVNDYLCKDNDAMMFVTWFGAIIDLDTGTLYCVNAGHNAPRLRRADGSLEILAQVDGVPFGTMTCEYTKSVIPLHPGDTIFCYTDGVTEAMSPERDQFGEERLDKVLLQQDLQASPHAWIQAVYREILAFAGTAPQWDDITMLCFRYLGGGKVSGAAAPEK